MVPALVTVPVMDELPAMLMPAEPVVMILPVEELVTLPAMVAPVLISKP
jgi:hypothetical protein